MRTVLTSFSEEERNEVRSLAEESKLSKNVDIVEDIFSFMKDPTRIVEEGDLTEELIQDFTNGKFEYYLPAKKKVQGRIEFFNRILSHPYYMKFKTLNPREGTSILLEMLNAFSKKKEEEEQGNGQGSKEKDEAMKQFEGIIKYGKQLFDLLDDEWFQELMKEQNIIAQGEGDEIDPKEMPNLVKKMSDNMSRIIQIYELSQKLEFTIRASRKGKYNEVRFPDSGLDVAQMKETRDVTKLLPSQYALDDDVFIKRLLSRDLLKKKYMQRQEKRQILYMLVDSSGSMDDYAVKGLSKIDVCKAVTIALMKKMISNEDCFYFRWFTDDISPLSKISTKEEALKFLPELVYGRGANGGTDIQNAIKIAADDLKNKRISHWDTADILLVSDGLASVDVPECNNMLEGIDMHTVMISRHKYDIKDHYQSQMVRVSKNFLMTSCNSETNVVDIANIFTK